MIKQKQPTDDEIKQELHKLNQLRTAERDETANLDPFTRGRLAGAQQALAWVARGYTEPARAILSDEQFDHLANARNASYGDSITPPTGHTRERQK